MSIKKILSAPMRRIIEAFKFASYVNKNTHPIRKFMAWGVCYEGKNSNVHF